ncbi:hypothetical protein [Streptomyces sp. Ac-502]
MPEHRLPPADAAPALLRTPGTRRRTTVTARRATPGADRPLTAPRRPGA